MSRTGQAYRAASPIEKTFTAIMYDTLRYANGSWRHYVRIIFVALFLMESLGVAPVMGQDAPAAPPPTPGPLDAPAAPPPTPGPLDRPPSPREQILAPIPRQFEWMNREAPAPLLLESQLGLRQGLHDLDFLVSLAEEYSDNFEQEAEEDAREEYRTSLTLETVYRYERGSGFLSLANSLGASHDALDEVTILGLANLNLNAGYRLPRVELALSESLVRSDELETASPSGLRDERNVFWRNIVSPQIRYALSRRTSLGLAYANTIVLNEGEDQNDSIAHAVTPSVEHRFSRSWVGRFGYTFTYTDEENIEPSLAYATSAELGYIVSRTLDLTFQLFGEGIGGGDDGEDSDLGGATIGARYRLRSGLGLFVAAGAAVFNEEDEAAELFPIWEAGLDGTWQITRNTSLTFNTDQGIENTENEVDNVGFVLRQTVGLRLAHTFSRRIQLSLFANFTHTEVLAGAEEADEGLEQNFWRTRANILYTLSPRWSLVAEYSYRLRDSNQNEEDFDENRVIITLSYNFSVF